MDLYLEHVYSDDFCLEAFLKKISVYQPFLMRTKYEFSHLCIFKQWDLTLIGWALY